LDASSRAALCLALARMAGGDRSAQREVFEATWPVMRDFCRKFLSNDADADDAAQRALIRLFEQSAKYDVSRDALAWALELAVWECRTARRRRGRERAVDIEPLALTVADGAASPLAVAERRELEAALGAALEKLPARDRQVLADEMTATEAGVGAATWRKRRERALGRLRLLWSATHER
jgi:RNA polymerase sigma factor (sigma-70 family)